MLPFATTNQDKVQYVQSKINTSETVNRDPVEQASVLRTGKRFRHYVHTEVLEILQMM